MPTMTRGARGDSLRGLVTGRICRVHGNFSEGRGSLILRWRLIAARPMCLSMVLIGRANQCPPPPRARVGL